MQATSLLTISLSLLCSSCIITVHNHCACKTGHREPLGPSAADLVSPSELPVTAVAFEESSPACEPPPILTLDSIPVKNRLLEGTRGVLAAFEVDEDLLVGVAYEDESVAAAALGLWREMVYRIPTNQRLDLVQFNITRGNDPAGSTDNSGTGSQTGRFGYTLSLSESNLISNPEDPCAPLIQRRGHFDWTMIHEFGHLRMYADGTINDYIRAFGSDTGEGRGYPEDGSPKLDGKWVSSYAERAGTDEDCVESFTTFVMLDVLPTHDSLASQKVRWFANRPGYPELRRALRITEFDGSTDPITASPRGESPLTVEPEAWMFGIWHGTLPDGSPIEYRVTSDEIVRFRSVTGEKAERWSYALLRERDPLATVALYESSDSFYLHQVSVAGSSFSESFRKVGDGMRVENERLGDFILEQR